MNQNVRKNYFYKTKIITYYRHNYMDAKYLFYITLVISIIVQIITGIIELGAFFVKVPTI